MAIKRLSHAASARDRSRTPVPFTVRQTSGQQLVGTVKNFNGAWGFLQSPETDGDIFCHIRDSPQFAGPQLRSGEAVKFNVVQGSGSERNNGLHALNVQRQGAGDMQEGDWVTGTVAKILGNMAFCSVQGIEADILVGERCLNDSGVNLMSLQLGQSLTFKMVQGGKGYHATAIQPPSQRWQQPPQHWQQPPPQVWQAPASQRVLGMLKKFSGGNAFCSVPGVADDVLLGSRKLTEAGINLTSMQVGDSLSFEMVSGPKGYHAVNIQQAVNTMWSQEGKRAVGTLKKIHGGNAFCSVAGVADDVLLGSRSLTEAGVDLATMQLGDSITFEMAWGSKGYHATNIEKSRVGDRVVGTLKKTRGGSGFCSVVGVSDDVLLGHRSLTEAGVDLATMQVGDHLTFEMAMGPKGYHATNIQQGADAQPDNVAQRVTGRLKRIQGSNGFCSVEGVTGDVLLGGRSLTESGIYIETMQVGDALSFEMARGPKGYHASMIQREPEIG